MNESESENESESRSVVSDSLWPRGLYCHFLSVSVVKNLPANSGDVGLIPRLGGSPGKGNGNPLQNSCLGNSVDRGACRSPCGRKRVGCDSAPKQQQYPIVYLCHNFFIRLSLDGLLGCFHVLATVNSAAVNTGVYVPFWIVISQGISPAVGLLGYMVVLLLVFKGISILFSIVAVSIYIPTNSARGFPFLYILPNIYCF